MDQACVDIIYSLDENDRHALTERIESRHGLRQLSYMKELKMGSDKYSLININDRDKEITAGNAAKFAVPFDKDSR